MTKPQKQKPRVRKVQELRRSSAAEPHRNRSKYNRTLKYGIQELTREYSG